MAGGLEAGKLPVASDERMWRRSVSVGVAEMRATSHWIFLWYLGLGAS